MKISSVNDWPSSVTMASPSCELSLLDARLLVVDDQEVNVLLLERMLESAGYRDIRSTVDPTRVRELNREHRFDLILLDIQMPVLDGYGVLAQLQEEAVDGVDYVPVLVLTAQTSEETRLRALEAGAKDFLTKPFIRTEVLTRIRNMLEVRLLHKALRNQNQLLEQRVRERTEELESTRIEIIRRLGRAAEFRDSETGAHIVRMSHYSAHLARAYGLDEERVELILQASPMHDVGKLATPDHILMKPGKLDQEEWVAMKCHAEIGARILDGHSSRLLKMACIIAGSHHEKWDGTGYPRGLKGEEIPVEGRVVAVADVFDALTSRRPYKSAWGIDDSVEEIGRLAGSHLDPALVEVFRQELDQILAIKHAFPETVV